MKYITRVKLQNFRRFANLDVSLDQELNVFIGENEAGKSSLLQAIHLTLSASRSQVETIGIDRLLSVQAERDFLSGGRAITDLPILYVELFLNEDGEFREAGQNNSENLNTHGLRMVCKPNPDLSEELGEILAQDNAVFPFDYYEVSFDTFAGHGYTGHRRFVSHLLIDTSVVSTEYATRDYIGRMYEAASEATERSKHQHEYRRLKDSYSETVLEELNNRNDDYDFGIRTDGKSNLASDLTLMQNGVGIESLGKGRQCFIKTAFALRRHEQANRQIDVVLLEEPENHLSHINMNRLVGEIKGAADKQLIVATHSNMLTARLDLRNTKLLHQSSTDAASLESLSEDTAKFFIKAPDRGVLDFILSRKTLLVEGDAEYILMEKFFETVTGRSLADENVNVLSVGGLKFKRYLELAALLDIKVAALRDNDGDYQSKCVDLYGGFTTNNARVFADQDNQRSTFEICVYQDNTVICDELFGASLRTNTVQDYMLNNKTDAAYRLLEGYRELAVPIYIREAIEWLAA